MDKKTPRGALFAASNSSEGFMSYYDVIFDRKNFLHFYIIKGGPGTGKSSFMRRVGSYFDSLGICVEFYYCSSDADSIDAIIIDGKIAILDGTSPHVEEIKIAGARDEIINLGDFWDTSKLERLYAEIEELGEEKQKCYQRAYKYLSACGNVSDIMEELIFPYLRTVKMLSSIERAIKGVARDGCPEVRIGLADSVGMKGRVHFDTYEKCAENLYYIDDCYRTAHFYLSALIQLAQRENRKIQVSYDPIIPQHPNCVYFCNSQTAFVIADANRDEQPYKKRINMRRFVDLNAAKELKQEFKYCERLYEALLSSAIEVLHSAGEFHFSLEKIYSEAMDFSALSEYTDAFCKALYSKYFK